VFVQGCYKKIIPAEAVVQSNIVLAFDSVLYNYRNPKYGIVSEWKVGDSALLFQAFTMGKQQPERSACG
jgi:hypothetical protein